MSNRSPDTRTFTPLPAELPALDFKDFVARYTGKEFLDWVRGLAASLDEYEQHINDGTLTETEIIEYLSIDGFFDRVQKEFVHMIEVLEQKQDQQIAKLRHEGRSIAEATKKIGQSFSEAFKENKTIKPRKVLLAILESVASEIEFRSAEKAVRDAKKALAAQHPEIALRPLELERYIIGSIQDQETQLSIEIDLSTNAAVGILIKQDRIKSLEKAEQKSETVAELIDFIREFPLAEGKYAIPIQNSPLPCLTSISVIKVVDDEPLIWGNIIVRGQEPTTGKTTNMVANISYATHHINKTGSVLGSLEDAFQVNGGTNEQYEAFCKIVLTTILKGIETGAITLKDDDEKTIALEQGLDKEMDEQPNVDETDDRTIMFQKEDAGSVEFLIASDELDKTKEGEGLLDDDAQDTGIETEVVDINATIPSEEIIHAPKVEVDETDSPGRTKKESFNVDLRKIKYTKIITTLRRLGVHIEKGNKYLHLSIGKRRANLHPRHTGNEFAEARALKRTLGLLGISVEDFIKALK